MGTALAVGAGFTAFRESIVLALFIMGLSVVWVWPYLKKPFHSSVAWVKALPWKAISIAIGVLLATSFVEASEYAPEVTSPKVIKGLKKSQRVIRLKEGDIKSFKEPKRKIRRLKEGDIKSFKKGKNGK